MHAEVHLDPIKFEVVRNGLLAATEEMGAALRRSAYSTNIKTRADFSCAFFDHDLQPVVQAFAQPVHLGSMPQLVPRVIEAYGPDNLGPGDAIVSNSPYLRGVHLNDVTVISPVFSGGDLFGYVANLAHHVDVGGGAPASIGAFQEVYQEGTIIPPVKLVEGGEIVSDIFNLILAQIRSKHETAGDLRAQVAANNTGVRRLRALLHRLGKAEVIFYMEELLAYTERRTEAEVAKLPRGVFTAEGYLDSDGFTDQPVRLVAKVVIDEEGVLFDLTGCDKQRRAPVNSTYAQTYSACSYVLKALVGPDVPVNGGFYRFVRVIAPESTVVNCTAPTPVVGGWETNVRLVEVILKALASGMPEGVPAGTKGMICHAGFGGIDSRTGDYWCFLETLAGGYGGRARSDGPDAVQVHGQNTENAPVEETEINYPVRVLRYELIEDSEGAGRHRGGLGLRRDYLFPDCAVTFTILADRDRWGPHGLFGGLPGRAASYVLNPEREAVELGSKVTVQLEPGAVVSYRTCGGGGYGLPEERDPQLVLRDVREGKVSAQRAAEVYCVAIDTEIWEVNEAGTKELRETTQGRTGDEEL